YRAVIFVSKQSTISKITQLKGGSFAFGDRLSTQGHLIPRKMLEDAGIYINDFKKYTYTGSHANTAKEVINGRYDAGAMQDNMAYRLQKEGKIKIIAVSKPYPSSLICCHKDLPPEVIDKIKNALLSFSPDGNHKERLYDWHKTEMPKGFTNVKEDSLKEIIYLSKRYTLLN
ncbi:MAG: PhnD/SsuA/transferrin family substrate-binding protein, partial [Thermodesulfovibrionales bacterium]|nr:PhnD/SsuA/transferrin family substrate-binding protein [Thermodesulfovibrionales bacterium]